MKKILPILVLGGLLVVLLMPMVVSAQVPEGCKIKNVERVKAGTNLACVADCKYTTPDCGMCCLLNTFYNVSDWIFFILIALAVLFIILGAMNLIMAAGDPEKINKGRGYIMYAFIGLIVAFLARAIPGIVKMIFGG